MTCERRRVRRRIVWSPCWTSEFQGYARNFIRENAWRVDPVHGRDDLMQIAWLVFDHLAVSYPRVITQREFMALFKRALANKFNDMSSHKRRRADGMPIVPGDVTEIVSGRIGEVSNGGHVLALLDEMPEELKIALDLLSRDVPHPQPASRPKRMVKRENLSTRICRSLGIARSDPVKQLKQLLSPT